MKRLIESLEAGVVDATGGPLAYGKVYSYDAGTTDPVTLYQDFELETPHPTPIILDAAGRAVAYVDGRVKLVIQDEEGTLVRTLDNVGTADSDLTAASNAGLAGNGLVAAFDGALDVNVDAPLTISAGKVAIAASGIVSGLIADEAITTAKIASGAVTKAKLVSVGHQISGSSGGFFTTSTTFTDVTNLSISITTSGRPVLLGVVGDGGGTSSLVINENTNSNGIGCYLQILRGVTVVSAQYFSLTMPSDAGVQYSINMPVNIWHLDAPAAGTYTYKVQLKAAGTPSQAGLIYAKLVAFEL